MSKNRVTVLLVDTSPSMGEQVEVTDLLNPEQTKTTTGLALGLEYVKEKIGEKLWRGLKTDRAAIFAFGSEKTNNSLAGVQEGYENIEELVPMGFATTTHYDKLRKIKASTVEGDALSAVVVAITDADNEVGRKKNWTKEIIVVTDGRSPTDWDGVEQIRDKLNDSKIELTVVGINFDDESLGYKEEDKPGEKRTNETMWSNLLATLTQPTAFGNAVRALDYVRTPRPSRTSGTSSKTILSLGDFDDDPEFALSAEVDVYKAIQMERPKSQKKMSTLSNATNRHIIDPARGKKRKRVEEHNDRETLNPAWQASVGLSQTLHMSQTQTFSLNGAAPEVDDRRIDRSLTFGVKSDRKYFYAPQRAGPKPLDETEKAPRTAAQAREEDRARGELTSESESEDGDKKHREEVPDDIEKVEAYKYGATRVPMSGIDKQMLILDAKAGIQILGFASRDSIRREYHLGLAWWVFGQPASGHSQVTLSVLVHALYEKDFVAIARYVAGSKNAAPKMVALYPRLQPEDEIQENIDRWEGLIMLQLPFSDDLRLYAFNSLERIVTKAGRQVTEHKNLPTEEMLEATRAFVDKADLDIAAQDEDGDPEPWYSTLEVCNPAVHAIKRAVLYRTANPSDPQLPPVHSSILKYFKPPESVVENSKDALQELVEAFDVKKVPPKPKKKGANATVTAPIAGDTHVAADYDAMLAEIDDSAPAPLSWGHGNRLGGPESETQATATTEAMEVDSAPLKIRGANLTDTHYLVGIDDPIGDFNRVLATRGEEQVDAIKELTAVAHELFKHTIGSSSFDKIIACMRRARDHSIAAEASYEWNEFIAQFKNAVLAQPHKQLWKRIQGEKLGLISVDEVTVDPWAKKAEAVSVAEADKFLQ